MNIIKYVVFLFFILYANTLIAQVPGYLGKKNVFLLKYTVAPNYYGPNTSNNGFGGLFNKSTDTLYTDQPNNNLTFSSKMGLQYERSLSKATSIKLSYDRLKTGVNMYALGTHENQFGDVYYRQLQSFQTIIGTEIALGLKFFSLSQGSISPMGVYFGIEVGYANYAYEVQDFDFHPVFSGSSEGSVPVAQSGQVNAITAGLELGYSVVMKDNLLLNFNVNTRIPVSGLFVPYDDYYYSGGSAPVDAIRDNQKIHELFISERMAYHNMFMLSIGIGFLL